MYRSTLRHKNISAFHLKIIALSCMIIDHIGVALFDYNVIILNCIGRISFPLYAFVIAESCKHTKSYIRFLIRLGFFSLISEIPFDLAFNGAGKSISLSAVDFFNHTNVFFTLFLSVSCIYIYDTLKQQNRRTQIILAITSTLFLIAEWILLSYGTSERIPNVLFIFLYIICVIIFCMRFSSVPYTSQKTIWFSKILAGLPIVPLLIQATFINCDYGLFGVLLVILLYLQNSRKASIITLLCVRQVKSDAKGHPKS